MWNPADTLRWNSEKTYLRELEAAGIRTIPTAWEGEVPWEEAIVKPTVAGGSLGLRRAEKGEPIEPGFMAQPFLPDIVSAGELSLVFFDGEFSHAVRKTPAEGDIRVQPEHGGIITAAEPTAAELEAAERVLEAAGRDLLYARVDFVGDGMLIELEAIEPRFFFEQGPPGAEKRLADGAPQPRRELPSPRLHHRQVDRDLLDVEHAAAALDQVVRRLRVDLEHELVGLGHVVADALDREREALRLGIGPEHVRDRLVAQHRARPLVDELEEERHVEHPVRRARADHGDLHVHDRLADQPAGERGQRHLEAGLPLGRGHPDHAAGGRLARRGDDAARLLGRDRRRAADRVVPRLVPVPLLVEVLEPSHRCGPTSFPSRSGRTT